MATPRIMMADSFLGAVGAGVSDQKKTASSICSRVQRFKSSRTARRSSKQVPGRLSAKKIRSRRRLSRLKKKNIHIPRQRLKNLARAGVMKAVRWARMLRKQSFNQPIPLKPSLSPEESFDVSNVDQIATSEDGAFSIHPCENTNFLVNMDEGELDQIKSEFSDSKIVSLSSLKRGDRPDWFKPWKQLPGTSGDDRGKMEFLVQLHRNLLMNGKEITLYDDYITPLPPKPRLLVLFGLSTKYHPNDVSDKLTGSTVDCSLAKGPWKVLMSNHSDAKTNKNNEDNLKRNPGWRNLKIDLKPEGEPKSDYSRLSELFELIKHNPHKPKIRCFRLNYSMYCFEKKFTEQPELVNGLSWQGRAKDNTVRSLKVCPSRKVLCHSKDFFDKHSRRWKVFGISKQTENLRDFCQRFDKLLENTGIKQIISGFEIVFCNSMHWRGTKTEFGTFCLEGFYQKWPGKGGHTITTPTDDEEFDEHLTVDLVNKSVRQKTKIGNEVQVPFPF